MKRCPTCQRTYPDNAPDACPYDGTFVVSDASQQQQYYPGAQQQPPPPYGAPPTGDPSQWQQPGGYYQQPGGAYPPPYGNPYAPATGGGGISKAALFTGIGAIGVFALGFIMVMIAISSFNISLAQFGAIMMLLGLVGGLAAVVLGIVVIVMAGKNPAINKVHGIIGLILGIIPIIFWIIGLANSPRYRY
jgi:hypothetical protein